MGSISHIRGRKWHRESASIGRQIGKLIAQGAGKPPVSDMKELKEYYRTKFGGVIPAGAQEQLDWALGREQFFVRLLAQDVLPLDVSLIQGEVLTLVEFLRRENFDQLSPAQREELAEYAVKHSSGHKRIRGLDGYMKYFASDYRPELRPIARPSEIMALRYKTTDSRNTIVWEWRMRRTKREPMRLESPGFFVRSGYRFINPSSKGLVFHRQCWVYLSDPAAAVEYLLSGGEIAQELRNNPERSIHNLARWVNYKMDLASHLVAYRHWAGDGWAGVDRPFISVTTHPERIRQIAIKGNLFIEVKTARAICNLDNIISLMEGEWLVPFVINPAEIVAVRFGDVRLTFVWSGDYTQLRVKVEGYPGIENLDYQYNPAKRLYEKFSAPMEVLTAA